MQIIKNENNRYEVRFKGPDGRIKSKSTGKTNRKEALQFIRDSKIEELERASELGVMTQEVVSILVHGRKITVETAIEPWLQWLRDRHQSPMSIRNAESWVRAWVNAESVGERPIVGITRQDIDAWVNNPMLTTKSGTRRQMLAAIRSLFTYASGAGMILGNASALVNVDLSMLTHEQKETTPRQCFTDDEVNQLLELTRIGGFKESLFWHAAVAIGRWTGLRLSDIACLEWECLKTPYRIAVWTQKRDKRVELPLEPDALLDAIQEIPMEDEIYLFPVQRLTAKDPELRSTLSVQFKVLCDHLGIEGKSFHCLRHTYCSACDAAGIPIEHIARSVGHSNYATTHGYIHRQD